MDAMVDLVAASVATVGGQLERAVFGTDAAAEVTHLITDHVATACSASPIGALFYRAGVGVVAGFELDGGQLVVLKVHRWNSSVGRLAAIQRVQAHVAAAGLPAPRPVAPPTPLGAGLATIEEYLPGGRADGRDPSTRRRLAAELHRFVRVASAVDGDELGPPVLLRPPEAALWPEPHSMRFDFEATSEGAEWIDDAGERARTRLLAAPAPAVVGHFDWRVENLGFGSEGVVAIYDWEALAVGPESVVVGVNAAQFSTDWTIEGADTVPTVDEMRSFVADYEHERGASFTPEERSLLDAANLALIAYGARCQHSDLTLHPHLGRSSDVGWLRLLHARPDTVW